MARVDQEFSQATLQWDLDTLYSDLRHTIGKPLTPTEKLHLRGLLCGYSPTEIAEILDKDPKGVQTDLCASIYKYVKSLVGKSDRKIGNWRNISEWLEDAGYRSKPPPQIPVNNLLPEQSTVNVTNIHIETNQIVFLINLRIPTSQASELPTQNSDSIENIINNGIAKDLME